MTKLTSSWDIPEVACPASERGGAYRPFDQKGMYAFFAEARREESVFYCPEIGYWVITKREDVLRVLRDPDLFSASIALSPVTPLPDETVAYLRQNGFMVEPTQVNCDRPKHTRIRRAARQFLNPKRFAAYESEIRELVRAYIHDMEGKRTVDIVAGLTYELPAKAIFLLLGIDDVDTGKIKKWSDNRLLMTWGKPSDEQFREAGRELLDFFNYCRDIVDERLVNPSDDYPSVLLAIRRKDPDALSLNEIVCLVFGLLLAGHETTTNASSNILMALLQNRAQWERLVADPELIPNAVEEGLRYASSVVNWRRRNLKDVEIGGVRIPEGSNLLISLASANHDEAQFENPEALDVTRPNAREHIAFGNGIHFCIGAPLARLEIKVILQELTNRFPNMRLIEGQSIDWVRTISFRGPERLKVELC